MWAPTFGWKDRQIFAIGATASSLALDFKLLKPHTHRFYHPNESWPPIRWRDHAQGPGFLKMKKFVTSRLPLTTFQTRLRVPEMTVSPASHTQNGNRGFNSPPIIVNSSGWNKVIVSVGSRPSQIILSVGTCFAQPLKATPNQFRPPISRDKGWRPWSLKS